MNEPRKFQDLGAGQQRFMLRAMYEGVAVDDPLATKHIRKGLTRADLLEERGLIQQRQSKKGRLSWRLTDTGRGLVMQHHPLFLNCRSFPGTTMLPWQAMRAEPEVIAA